MSEDRTVAFMKWLHENDTRPPLLDTEAEAERARYDVLEEWSNRWALRGMGALLALIIAARWLA